MQEKTLLEEIQDDYQHPKRKKRVRKEKKKNHTKAWLLLMVVIAICVAIVIEKYADWRAEHEWQFPTRWIGFVRGIENVTPIANAATVQPKSDMEVIEQYELSPVLKTVYFLESTSGKNDGCKEEGKFNGYGFAQNSAQWKCYDSFEKVTERVNDWFVERLSMNGNDLVEAVCLYNTGIQGKQVCDYSINFFSVLTKNF